MIACSGLIIALAIAWKLLPVGDYLRITCDGVRSCGNWGVVAYFAIYVVLVLFAFPNTPLNIGAGLLFHFVIGFAVAMSAALLGSCLCFLFARYLARDWISRRVDRWNGRWLLTAVDDGGFPVMLLARLNPMLPGSVKNFGFGVTTVPLWKFVTATFLGQAPVIAMYVYLGWAGMVTLDSNEDLGVLHYALLGAGLILSIALATALAFFSRRKLVAT